MPRPESIEAVRRDILTCVVSVRGDQRYRTYAKQHARESHPLVVTCDRSLSLLELASRCDEILVYIDVGMDEVTRRAMALPHAKLCFLDGEYLEKWKTPSAGGDRGDEDETE